MAIANMSSARSALRTMCSGGRGGRFSSRTPQAAATVPRVASPAQPAGALRGARSASLTPGSASMRLESRQALRRAAVPRRAVSVAAAAGLSIDLTGKKAFIAGVADDQGFGWAIAKMLAEAGCEVSLGVWVPALNIFETSLRRGKFDESRKLSDGSMMEFAHVFGMDAVYDTPEDVPEEVRTNKRYAAAPDFTVSEVAAKVEKEVGKIDILIHSLANGPEVQKPLMETSRQGYLAAMSASSYSLVSMVQRFAPVMNEGGAVLSLTYLASTSIIPGYGGGMSSAKAALESDTRVLAYEAGRKHKIRVNAISAGPLGSRAAKAIGFIDKMINYSYDNAPVQKELSALEIGQAAAFLCSPLASAITGQVVFVDNGLGNMGVALNSKSLD
mmetsp:Transcript_10579/g.25065  ORF Transcript_10579/g.25065 Transcript_10579/m.25065 type:complete len:387 (-) Transcript_10579:129-1289(-)